MEVKLQLCVFLLLIQVSLAVYQQLTVAKGQTVDLICPIINPHQTSVEWKNPRGFVMFFKHRGAIAHEGVKDVRYNISTESESEFTVSISDVTYEDGGNYTCSHYDTHITEKTVEVTVIERPRLTKTKRNGKFDLKCTAEANHPPPQIIWQLDNGPEIRVRYQVLHEGKKYVSMAMLHVQSVKNSVIVRCLVRHPSLHSQPLDAFVRIGRNSTSRRTTTISTPTAQPQGSTTGWFKQGGTTVFHVSTDVNGPSSESSVESSTVPSNGLRTVTAPTGFPLNPVTSTDSHLSTRDNSSTSASSGSAGRRNDTISNTTSSAGWTSVSEATEITTNNSTGGNGTGSFNDPETRTEKDGKSNLLVLLVAFLIFCLLVVVIFFGIKLRRAHLTWKRENEESDPSEESSKSKSSQEEKNSQGQRRRGLFNTAFTKYDVEEAPVITSVINTAAMAATQSANTEQTPRPQASGQTSAKCDIKETEL